MAIAYHIGAWRNRQTRQPQKLAGAGPCGFESRRPDQGYFALWIKEQSMSYVAKAAIFCDRCGSRVDLDPKFMLPLTFSPLVTDGTPISGWLKVDESHHLCPGCAAAYKAKKAEMERELRELAGIREIRFEL